MGRIATARTAFKAALATYKATGATRPQLRKFVAAMVDGGNEWLSKFDAQETAAPTDFAATRAAQFSTYVATLPEPTLADKDDPTP